jgi:flagellar hook-basal body complex protein FliE
VSISPISAISGIAEPTQISAVDPVGGGDSGSVTGSVGGSFANALSHGLEQVQDVQTKADDLAVKAATGSLTDVHDYMIASSEASLATQLTVAVRNKALDAFNEIMRMQA